MKYKSIPLLPLLTAAAATAVFVQYRLSMRTAHERLRGKSTVIPSPYGNIEYTEHGAGSNVLVIHGSGGGFDQGELLAHIVALIEVDGVGSTVQKHIIANINELCTQVPAPESAGI
jgi:hypothetical protein